ncbi:hypothetical protein [Shigella sonnei]|uniref:hypothetical protein n=1 Tax=Shigella sonnei TaxID=624 RepID=UPI00266FC949|nr:hypothetical protein [Shigella sonnei]
MSSTKINTSILSSVSEQIGENITDWKNDEKKVYVSRVVNQCIDKFCAEHSREIGDNLRKQIFKQVEKDYRISNRLSDDRTSRVKKLRKVNTQELPERCYISPRK